MKIMQRLSGSFSAAAFVALATTFVPFGMGVSISSSAVAAVLPDFTDLVDKVGPAVVNIRTTERAKGMQPGQGAPTFVGQQFDLDDCHPYHRRHQRGF